MRNIIVLLLAAALVVSQATAQPAATVPSDSAKADSAYVVSDQYKVIKKELAVSDQVKVGSAVMIFIVVVMAFMNNFNPG